LEAEMKSRRVSIEPNMPMSKHSPPMDSRSWEGGVRL
jgi:hypothetical protein